MSDAPTIPAATWRLLSDCRKQSPLPKGLDAGWDIAGGWLRQMTTTTRRFLREARRVMSMEKTFAEMTDANLREQAIAFRDKFRLGRDDRDDLHRAFALIREVASRQLGQKHYLVQLAGGLALNAGSIVEMATGEGKTLTAIPPATVEGWRGKGCHVITANDYLAQRDAEWMTPIYNFLGLRVAHVAAGMEPDDRREAYLADITYGTNKEMTADFLRDRLALGRQTGLPHVLLSQLLGGRGPQIGRLVQRGLHCAIIDEADSLMIDEAVTPLIISGAAPNAEQVDAFGRAAELAGQLNERDDYTIDDRWREVELTPAGKEKLVLLTAPLGGIWQSQRRSEELVVQALTARVFYLQDHQYVIQEEKVVIVDEFTGRLMPDREWRDGLHQAVEAKEGLEVNPPKDTFARVSFQRFFRLYRKLSGMTGTAAEARAEFWRVYHLPVVVIPTNRPCIRDHKHDRIFSTVDAKWEAIVEEIEELHATDRPILIGTRSVRASEHLSEMLQKRDLPHQVLNAVRHAEEAQIVAEAGQPGKITVATNMAGRGTDIKLGRGVSENGGLYVIATERHESGRIDRQLFGRSARQGDPGTAQAFVSLEDELINRYAPRLAALARRLPEDEKGEINSAFARRLFGHMQRRARRIALRQRQAVLQTDDWLDEYLGFAKDG